MAIYDFFVSRNGAVSTPANYVGHTGRLFYDSATGEIRISDGSTPGGLPIPYNVATSTVIGGIKAGPGANVSVDGTLTIDTTGLPLGIGNLQINDTTISVVTANRNLILTSRGTGNVDLVGNVHFHTTASGGTGIPFFQATGDGQITMRVQPTVLTIGGVEIIGNAEGNFQSPVNTGVMLHITGNEPDGSPTPARLYVDGVQGYAGFIGRRYNGISNTPAAVALNDEVMRVGANAYRTGGWTAAGSSSIRFIATENQTATAQGMKIDFYSTAVGTASSAISKVMSVEAGVGVTATRFVGSLTGDVTGNVTGTAPAGSLTGTTLAATVITSSLTTVGTLGSLTVTNQVSAKNYNGQARDAGTLGAAGTLTIDFATDHNVLVNLTSTATIAFANITAGKTVTVLVKNASGANRAVTVGVAAGNTSNGDAAPNVNNNRTGVLVYRTFGTATTDVYCEFN